MYDKERNCKIERKKNTLKIPGKLMKHDGRMRKLYTVDN